MQNIFMLTCDLKSLRAKGYFFSRKINCAPNVKASRVRPKGFGAHYKFLFH